jgi:hypothetical protein
MGEVLTGRFGGVPVPDVVMTKTQFSRHPAVRRSRRWVEQQVAQGMPSELRREGKREYRIFRLAEALAWLGERGRLRKGVQPPSCSEADALAARRQAEEAKSKATPRTYKPGSSLPAEPAGRNETGQASAAIDLPLPERVAAMEQRIRDLERRLEQRPDGAA